MITRFIILLNENRLHTFQVVVLKLKQITYVPSVKNNTTSYFNSYKNRL